MAIWETLPGETPIGDISGLKIKGITTRKQLSFAEAENILEATVKYLEGPLQKRSARFDLSWCLRLHREMFGNIWTWAGETRQENLNFGVPWHQVQVQLQGLLDDLVYWEAHWPSVLEQAVHLHYRAVRIHPFMNGNGRWSRMLGNIWLRLHHCPITLWPEQAIGTVSTIRTEYLDSLKFADETGDMTPLTELHERFSDTTDLYRPMDDKPDSG